MPDMQIPVGLRRKPRGDPPAVRIVPYVVLHDLPYKMRTRFGSVIGGGQSGRLSGFHHAASANTVGLVHRL